MESMSDIIAESGRSLKRMLSFERKRVYSFSEGSIREIRLLGQKGAALCELTQLGLPVPPGFIITTENFLEYINQHDGHEIGPSGSSHPSHSSAHGEHSGSLKGNSGLKNELERSYLNALHILEHQTGRVFGKPSHDGKKLPLLLAVRAGTAVIVPG